VAATAASTLTIRNIGIENTRFGLFSQSPAIDVDHCRFYENTTALHISDCVSAALSRNVFAHNTYALVTQSNIPSNINIDFSVFALIILISLPSFPQKKSPSFEEVLSLSSVSSPRISPDGKHVVFQKSAVDWKNNRYDTELWISRDGIEPIQLTNNRDGSSSGARWTPDGRWISFISDRSGENQVWIIRFDGGEPFQVTRCLIGGLYQFHQLHRVYIAMNVLCMFLHGPNIMKLPDRVLLRAWRSGGLPP